jgi:hypothetical protein
MSPKPFGPGEWQIDDAPGDPDPTPVTTIAWRLGHLHLDFAGTWEWTFGGRRQPPAELVDFSPSAAVALERFWATMDRWRDSVAAVTPEQLDTVGYSQYPYSDAAELPFITVIWAGNLEFIHHMAEIALLRDLYRTHPAGARWARSHHSRTIDGAAPQPRRRWQARACLLCHSSHSSTIAAIVTIAR